MRYVSFHTAFQHPPHSFPSQQKTVSSILCNKPAIIVQEHIHLQNSVGEPSEQTVLRNRGKFPCLGAHHCSVASKVSDCGWKTESTELCPSVLVEKHSSTNRPIASCQGGSYTRKMLTYREHNNSPAGGQTVLHFTRYLLLLLLKVPK